MALHLSGFGEVAAKSVAGISGKQTDSIRAYGTILDIVFDN
jgi:hypothetical protein